VVELWLLFQRVLWRSFKGIFRTAQRIVQAIVLAYWPIYTVSQKTRHPTHIDNFAKIDRFSIFFTDRLRTKFSTK